jgi:hypothetical protein
MNTTMTAGKICGGILMACSARYRHPTSTKIAAAAGSGAGNAAEENLLAASPIASERCSGRDAISALKI